MSVTTVRDDLGPSLGITPLILYAQFSQLCNIVTLVCVSVTTVRDDLGPSLGITPLIYCMPILVQLCNIVTLVCVSVTTVRDDLGPSLGITPLIYCMPILVNCAINYSHSRLCVGDNCPG